MKDQRPTRPIDPVEHRRRLNERLRAEFMPAPRRDGASGPGVR
jgi:hypothetical protein